MDERERRVNRTHIAYLDRLRVLAAFAVVVIHVSGQNLDSTDVTSAAWMIFNLYNSAVRWAVAAFIMVSGALFLNKEIGIKVIFKKYILRLVVAYVFWSFLYAVMEGEGVKRIISITIRGQFHMWYIPMIIGVYLCIPIYQQIVKNDGAVRYFLGISVVIAFLIPNLILLLRDFGSEVMSAFAGLIETHLQTISAPMMLGCSIYFILGYYLSKTDFTKKQRAILYIAGAAGCFVTAFTTYLASRRTLSTNSSYYSSFMLCTLAQSVAVFVFCKYYRQSESVQSRVWASLSKASFGIYWIHPLLLDMLKEKMMVDTLSFFPAISVPVISIIVFALSFAVSWVIGKIPLLKRCVV